MCTAWDEMKKMKERKTLTKRRNECVLALFTEVNKF